MTLAASMATLPACAPTYPPQKNTAGTYGATSSVTPAGTAAASSAPPSRSGALTPADGQILTDYLKSQRLPLVSAQVVDGGSGARQVILYGFVATNAGKSNAEAYTRRYLNDPGIVIDNRIKVSPELAKSAPAPAASSGDPYATTSSDPYGSTLPGPEAYQQQYSTDPYASRYQYQSQNQSLLMTLLPLIAIIGGFGVGTSGGSGFGYSGGFGSGYGYPNYSSPPPPYGYSPSPPGTP